jgi:glycosyltransferase involved in cell wall biosynthesis
MAAQITETREHDNEAKLASEQDEQAASWFHARNVAPARLHIIMPVLNEEAALRVLLPSLTAAQRAATIVVDNGSNDGSMAEATRAGVRVVQEPQRGYGAACLAGIAALGAADNDDIVLFMDGDASDDVADIATVLAPVERAEADLVIGSRVLGTRERGALSLHARAGNWIATRWIYLKTGVRYSDLGPLRALRVGTLRSLCMQDRDYGWTVEMQLKAAQQQLCIREVPVRYKKRIGRSKISGTWRGSLRAGWVILRTIRRHGR